MRSKLPQTATSIFSVMSALANEHKAINLSQGFPNFPISDDLKNFVVEALNQDQVQYAPMAGRQDLREEISKLISKRHSILINPETEITVTAGATQAIFTAIATLIHAGDEVIMFDPAYDCYDPAVVMFGAKPIHLKLRYPEFSIDWEELEQKITPKTRLIIFNNPHNPTGSVWKSDDLKQLEKILSKNPDLYLISDEVYEYIQFENDHQSVLKSDLLRQRSFVTYSFGKTLHVTGWKVGYCVAPPKLTAEFRKIHQFNVFCVNNTIQFAVTKYLQQQPDLSTIKNLYKQKRDLFLSGIKNSKFIPLVCDGTYFCLLDYSHITNQTDTEFARELTIKNGVASIPVSVFYNDQTDNRILRFCFAKTDETLINATERLCKI